MKPQSKGLVRARVTRETRPRERAALVGLTLRRSKRLDAEHSLEELAGLADAAGATVALRMIQERPTPDPATFLGSGKLDELSDACARVSADVVIFDNELSPAQASESSSSLPLPRKVAGSGVGRS